MSFEELKREGMILPEDRWGRMDLSTSVNRPALLLILILGVTSCGLMAAGAGSLMTWVGMILFVVFLILFTLVSNAGIDRQNEACDRLLASPPSRED